MLLCSNCPNEFVQGKACEICSKLFCSLHQFDTCVFCGGKLKQIHNEVEEELRVNWLTIEGNKQIGIMGLDFLPSYIMKIWSTIRLQNIQIKIIVFDSKENSNKFEKALKLKIWVTIFRQRK